MRNLFIAEAVGEIFDPKPIVTQIKKQSNVCRLSKYNSLAECGKLYSIFFLGEFGETVSFKEYQSVYMMLLNDDTFYDQLCMFIAMYRPAEYRGMFQPIMNTITSELTQLNKNRMRYLSNAKAFYRFLATRLESVSETVKSQDNDMDTIKFLTVIRSTINSNLAYLDTLTQRELKKDTTKDDIVQIVNYPLDEDVQLIFETLQSYPNWYNAYMASSLNEGIVSNAKEKAKELIVKEKKAARAFDELVTKQVKKARENRRNRKHAEMVGEALRINNEVKRLLKSLAIGALNPALGVISWVVSVIVDRSTDKRDRDILIGQIKDELEIIEEKITQADRNGDDKAKVQLIRARQKLQREYERINRMRFDPTRMQR